MKSFKKSIISLLGIAILFSLFQPFGVSAAETDETSNIDQVQKEIKKYINTSEDSITFDLKQARDDGQSDFIIEVGQKLNQINAEYNANSNNEDQFSTLGLSLPIWGNWCGPGYGGGSTEGILDHSCMMHDKEYERYGYFDCGSDARLIGRINRHYDLMGSSEKVAANAVKAYFTFQMNARGCIGYL